MRGSSPRMTLPGMRQTAAGFSRQRCARWMTSGGRCHARWHIKGPCSMIEDRGPTTGKIFLGSKQVFLARVQEQIRACCFSRRKHLPLPT
jgi:hypothetical protein